MSDATADERLTAGMQVFLECLTKSGEKSGSWTGL